MNDLTDIETINVRVERDVEFRTQQRVKKFGVDGKRIIGIDIKIPDLDRQIQAFHKRQQEEEDADKRIKDDLYYTQKMVDQRDLEDDNAPKDEMPPEQELPIKNTDVYLGAEPEDPYAGATYVQEVPAPPQAPAAQPKTDKEKDTTTFALTAMGDQEEEESPRLGEWEYGFKENKSGWYKILQKIILSLI